MTKDHLNDIEIQLYVLDKKNCSNEMLEHYNYCDECKSKADQYACIIAGVKQQEAPVFNFDLPELVMKQLPIPQATSKFDSYFLLSIAAATLFLAFLAIYLYGIYVPEISFNVEPLSLGLILVTVVSVLLIYCGDLITKFHNQMKILNFY